MTTSDPSGRHDWHSDTYVDEWIVSSTARDAARRMTLRRVAVLLPYEPQSAIRVLDVGAGYGALSAQILARFPRAELVCQDFSEPMFEHARKRLAWASSRVTFAKSDLSKAGWTDVLEGPFDAVVSAIAIHNVRHLERIRAIYREIYEQVAAGGCFLNAELMFPTGRYTAAAYERLERLEDWIQGDGEQDNGPVATSREASGASQQAGHGHAHNAAGSSARTVERASLEQQLSWLREAGFVEVDCFWKEMRRAIIGGFRT